MLVSAFLSNDLCPFPGRFRPLRVIVALAIVKSVIDLFLLLRVIPLYLGLRLLHFELWAALVLTD